MNEDKKGISTLGLICLLFAILISLIITASAPSIYKHITINDEQKYQQQTEKVNNKKTPIKRLYKDAFQGRK